jgi:tetratricopeptide (TPR) repeat protein
MNKNKNLISKYLGGEMDPVTAARFEEELRNDPQLREEMELYREVDEALADSEVLEFRMHLQELHEQLAPEIYAPPVSTWKKFARVAVAASVIAVLGFAVFSYFQTGNTGNLIDKYYKPYEITSTNRSVGASTDRTLQSAMEKYQNHHYRDAVYLFEKVLANDPGQMGTLLYSGISYYELAEYQKAGKSFTAVIDQNDNLYIEQAKWYMGFCYLKTDEKEKAIKQFSEIAQSKSYYSEKAKAILKRLR